MRLRAAAGTLAVAAALAACSSEAAPPSTLPSLSATPSASPSAAAVPSEAAAPTPEGAGAFARFWFDQLNAAARTGDTASLKDLSDPTCESCTAFVEGIEILYEPGGRIEGGVFTLVAAESPALEDAEEARVTVVYNVTPTRQIAADGSVIREVPALERVAGEMALARKDGSWTAMSIVVQQ